MIRHAKATTTHSAGRKDASSRPRLLIASLAVLALILALGVSLAGAAKPVHTVFGKAGTGDGQFGEPPRGVAVNVSGAGGVAAGSVYVADPVNNRVQRFDADGKFAAKFGSAGSDAGQLTSPVAVAVDQEDGSLYVFDQGNLRIAKYSATGTFLFAFGAGVADGTTDALQTCTATCFQGLNSSVDGGLGTTSAAPSLAVAPAGSPHAGDLFVADPGEEANRRVQHFDAPGATGPAVFVKKAGVSGSALGEFGSDSPTSVAVDDAGRVYVTDNGNNRVQRFDAELESPAVFAEAELSGSPSPTRLAIDPGPVSAGDASDDRVFAVKPCDHTICPPESLPSPFHSFESRIKELATDGTLLDTHLEGSGITSLYGIAQNPATERIYASSDSSVFILDDVLAPTASIDPVSVFDATSATFTGEVDSNGSRTDYHFEYSDDGGATWTSLGLKDAGNGDDPVAVSDEVIDTLPDDESAPGGLEPNTTYSVRLQAIKPFAAASPAITGPVSFTTDPVPPALRVVSPTVLEQTAELHAAVDPRNAEVTDCHFEWGPTVAYGNSVPCEELPGAGGDPVPVSAKIEGLAKDATYHYRLVATNVGGTSSGPDQTLSTAFQTLPDNRAWELVSPPNKDGYDISPASWSVRAADDGGAVSFMSLGAFGDARGSTAWGVDYISQRGASGWATHAITPKVTAPLFPGAAGSGWFPGYMGGFSSDLTDGVFLYSDSITPADPNVDAVSNIYLRDNLRTPGAGNYHLLSQCPGCTAPLPREEPFEGEPLGLSFAGASDDFSHVIFESGDNLTGQTTGVEPKLYEWLAATEEIRLVGILPDDECGSPPCISAEGAIAGSGAAGTNRPGGGINPNESPHYRLINNAISDDGSRIFFTTPPYDSYTLDQDTNGELYYRDNGSVTTQVNVSERTDCAEEEPCDGTLAPDPAGHKPAAFMAASGDGRYIYFLSAENLTDDNQVGLYRADLDQPEGSRLQAIASDVRGVPGISQDGEVVYYLAPLKGGEYGLYVWNDGVTKLVAEHFKDTYNGHPSHHFGEQGPTQNNTSSGENGFRITEDGQHVVFPSSFPANAAAVGYDNTHAPGARCEIADREECIMIFVYDLQADELRCASCNPTGAPPLSDAAINITKMAGPTIKRPDNPNHAVTEDGTRVFFASADPLVPRDQNGRYDVYQYDTRSGSLALLTSGAGNADAFFMNAAPDGSSVFFTTRERLVGWDTDENIDIYAARTDGGFPEPPRPPEGCQGDACQPPPAALNDQTPSSTNFSGPGNQAERRAGSACPRGKRVKSRNGKQRCVNKRRAKNGKASRRHAGSNRRAAR